MKTILDRFKVINFRSIEESDWIEVSDNTCLVGTNEAGKTNLLIALWKLRPANNEPIVPLDDFPRNLYSKYKTDNHSEDVFIQADFILNDKLANEISSELDCDIEQVKRTLVQRKYNGEYRISFPYSEVRSFSSERIITVLNQFKTNIANEDFFIKESDENKNLINDLLENLKKNFEEDYFVKSDIEKIIVEIQNLLNTNFSRKKNIPEYFANNISKNLQFFIDAFDAKPITTTKEIRQKVLKNIPKFVYYSDYGNLDSEIFLPRVIEDLERKDLSESARAKVRTLDVLFKYVGLSPQEIYELGNDRKVIIKKLNHYEQEISSEEVDLTDDEVKEWSEKKKERGVLLRSAATELTTSFKKWWLQGDYIFDFQADGNHFRINVSDKLRPEHIELEGRSRGLQWFFSFFLVFLVETKEEHNNTILLLDEPGLSLHPIAQYDLAKFFRKLSEDNQLLYTSHSPFLVDMDNLANVKAVYVDLETGRTKVSSNLRYNETDAEKSIYPVHAALGLTVSDTLLLGCKPILVEGPSDQIYLSLIKRFLIGNGDLKYSKEIVFIPTGGVRGMSPVSKLVASRDNDLPIVLLDSDKAGEDFQKQLKTGKYLSQKEKVIGVKDFIGEDIYEIEDLLEPDSLIRLIDKKYRAENDFEDFYTKDKPIVNQVEEWARTENIILEKGWKVDIARDMQNKFDKNFDKVDEKYISIWKKLFEQLLR
ncbi:AAA family ATPase [Chryseobacterium capnotolerans]|uniref:AAA family ATPase n=1 Tax=Chryseobacterium TaxID=59732 RepID=UPI00083A105A|nr:MULTISPECIES: AAA family ATPase [Chryseobacterium]UHO40612.1 AAA family ATPase [Chryseobacterium capnotolerans]